MRVLIAQIVSLVGGITLLLLLGVAGLLVYRGLWRKVIPRKTILEADFEQNYVEVRSDDRLKGLIMGRAPQLLDVVVALDRASKDDRVALLVAKVGASEMKLGKIQEIREAVIRFRGRGKKAFAYAETFGEFGSGSAAYYLAAAFDRIYLQPSGNVGLTGLSMKTPFLRDLLDKVGVEPRLAHRREYKSAAYLFTEREYNEHHRKADQAVLQSLMSQIVDGISLSRGFTREQASALVAKGPFSATEALRENLVDGLAYRDEVYEAARKEAGETSRPLGLSEYLKRAGHLYSGKRKIALIYGVGPIVRGKSRSMPLGGQLMSAKSVAESFRKALKDKSVKAILFRINSPGGSYVASDVVWRETVRAKQQGKPVIVSMSEVAASGGYFVASAAHKIIAHPATITGSIGVIGGKMLTSQMWGKIGVRWGELFTHENAALWSSTEPYSPEQWERIQRWLDTIYDDFVTKVAEGRRLDVEKVHEIAKGRIWSGKDAKDIGLVDGLGGFEEALSAAKAAAGIAEEERVGLKIFPGRECLLKRLLLGRQERREVRITAGSGILQQWAGSAGGGGLLEPVGALQMREMQLE